MGKATDNKGRSRMRGIANAAVVAVNAAVTAGMLLSSYCSGVAPSSWADAVLVAMTFPAWVTAAAVLFVADLIWWKRTALVPGLGMLLCMTSVNAFCPLHFGRGEMDAEERARSFTLMTYNVFLFRDQTDKDAVPNRQIEYIMAKQPDLLCLDEAQCFVQNKTTRITDEQMERLHEIYPYFFILGEDVAFLSKYPAEAIDIDFPFERFRNGAIGAWRVYVHGKVVNVFAVHLRSLYFSNEEKGAFKEMTSIGSADRSAIGELRAELLPKIKAAALEREEQVKLLSAYIERYGGENVIVCGDFNDPVGSYPLYYLKKHNKMHDAYAETGFGPMITYNANHFFFRIDHILYRGAMMPWSMKRGDIDASDHYPLEATFVVE